MRIKILFTALVIATFTAVTASANSTDSIRAQASGDAGQYYNEHKSDPGWDYNSIEVYNYSHRKAAERGFTANGDDSVYASAFSDYLTSLAGKPVTHPSSTPATPENSPQSALSYPKPEANKSAIEAAAGFLGALWILLVLLGVVYAIMCFLVPIFIYRIMRRTTQMFELMQRQQQLPQRPTVNNESALIR